MKKKLELETVRLEELFSDYDSLAHLALIQGQKGDTLVLQSELYDLLSFASELQIKSRGAFHINLHALKSAWGLGSHETPQIPDSVELLPCYIKHLGSKVLSPLIESLGLQIKLFC